MFADPSFRQAFRRDWESRAARVFHRNLADMWVVASPLQARPANHSTHWPKRRDASRSNISSICWPNTTRQFRWKTVVTNDRDAQRHFLFAVDTTLPGFNDSGAHARNMAFQDGGLQMLQQVLMNPQLMTIEKAVHKLTGQSGDVARTRRRFPEACGAG